MSISSNQSKMTNNGKENHDGKPPNLKTAAKSFREGNKIKLLKTNRNTETTSNKSEINSFSEKRPSRFNMNN
jgi:hypothetical protein